MYIILHCYSNDDALRKGQQVHQHRESPLQLHLLFDLIKILIAMII